MESIWEKLTSFDTYAAPLIFIAVVMIFGFPYMKWKRKRLDEALNDSMYES